MGFFWTIVTLVIALGITWRYLGSYMAAVFEGRVHFFAWAERPIYRALGTSPENEQSWKRYAASMVIFSAIAMAVTYLIIRIQGSLPLNPQGFDQVHPALSFNTAASFMTNTNWQNYGGETTMSYFSQIGALTLEQLLSPVIGIAVAIALVRGFSRRNSPTIGNFWVDMTRGLLYIVIPIAFVAGIIFVGQGAVQTLAGPVTIHNSMNGVTQTIPRGPIGFMESIKQLGNNGGGFLNANSATTFENPTGLTNWLSMYLLLAIPFSLTYTFGKMVGSIRHGAALLGAMLLIFAVWVGYTSYAEHQNNPAVAAAGVHSTVGNTEGKEVRFGDTSTALFGVASTNTSTGSADASYDSFTPIGGMGLMTGMMLGEVTPGGSGSGLYTILIYAIIAVFIGGLMIGRTPEYLGKKIQAREVKLAGLGALVMPIIVLVFTGIAVSIHAGRAGPLNAGPHGFSEILYALTSQGNNNGSAFGGLTGNTAFYNVIGGIDMLLGRVGIMIPALALGGSLAAKKRGPRVRGDVPHRQRHVHRAHHRRDRHHRRVDLLPGHLARADCRATEPREVLLMEMEMHETATDTVPTPAESGQAMAHGVAEARRLFDREILRTSVVGAFRKLDPRVQIKNPVMFVVLVGSVITLIYSIRTPGLFDWSITIWLILTVLFANFAEAMAEGRGKAQADTLRRMRSETEARLLGADGTERRVAAAELAKGDMVVCEAGDVIPSDGEITEGVASVDESAITGESAPVIRESGGDRSAVTGGTRVLSDRIVVRITAERPHVPRSHDQPGGRSQPAKDAQRGRPHHPVGRAHHRLHPGGGGAPALRPLCRRHRFAWSSWCRCWCASSRPPSVRCCPPSASPAWTAWSSGTCWP